MEKHPEIGVCGSWAQVIDENNTITGKIINQTDPEFIRIHLLFSVPLIQPSYCIRSALLKNNLYHEFTVGEDYDLYCRLNEQTCMANLPEFLLQYRWHNANVSKEKNAIQLKIKQQIIYRELHKLNLYPDNDTLRIHSLSFSLYGFNSGEKNIQLSDLSNSARWFGQLLSANREQKRYNHWAFSAFLWTRWIVLCLFLKQKRKIFFPQFINYHPFTFFYLWKQLRLLSRK
jgi:hypothetical protein